MRNTWYSAIAALQFLTRIPIRKEVPFTNEVLKRSTIWFPLAGAAIGCLVWIAGVALQELLPAYPAAALVLLFAVVLSGGLHLDGLMDTADGLLSSRDRERMIEIMKDSRVGAMGVIACVMVLLLQWSLIASLLEVGQWSPLVVIPFMMSRLIMVWAIVRYPHTEAESGLGRYFMDTNARHLMLAMVVMLILFSICVVGTAVLPYEFGMESSRLLLWGGLGCLALIVVPIMLTAFLARIVERRIGGLSGDIYGCMGELTLTAGLAVLVIGVRFMGGGVL